MEIQSLVLPTWHDADVSFQPMAALPSNRKDVSIAKQINAMQWRNYCIFIVSSWIGYAADNGLNNISSNENI